MMRTGRNALRSADIDARNGAPERRYIKAKYNQNLTEAQLYAGRAVDRDLYLDMISMVTEPAMAKGYRLRMERHSTVYP